MTRAYYHLSHAILFIYDITRKNSFLDYDEWMRDISDFAYDEDRIIIAVGNKSDLSENRQVTQDDINDFKQRTGIDVIEVSAKTSYNINELMDTIKRMLMSKKFKPRLEEKTEFSLVKYKLNKKQDHGCCK